MNEFAPISTARRRTAKGSTSGAGPLVLKQTKGSAQTSVCKDKGTVKMDYDISGVADIAGFIGGCLVDIDSGMTLASEGGGESLDLEAAAAMNADFVKAKLSTMQALGLKTHIEDILITLGTQIHLIRPLEKNQKIFIYVALDRKTANLGRSRLQVKEIESSFK